MLLDQIHYMWRDLDRAKAFRVAPLLVGPLAVFAVLALLLRAVG